MAIKIVESVNAEIYGNVVTEGIEINRDDLDNKRGWGIVSYNSGVVTVRENIVTTRVGGQEVNTRAWIFEQKRGAEDPKEIIMSNNTIVDWYDLIDEGYATYTDNIFDDEQPTDASNVHNSEVSFVNRNVSIADYHASIGDTATWEAFSEEVSKQSRTNWRPEYSTAAILDYFRSGLSLVPGSPHCGKGAVACE